MNPLRLRALSVSLLLAVATGGIPGIAVAQETPRFLVHYQPWFQSQPYRGYWGFHWTMGVLNPEIVDGEGRRQIASHYYPLVGPYDSNDPVLLEYHTLLMRVAGIDGVVVDWYGTGALYDYPLLTVSADRLFDAVGDAGLLFTVCYEDNSLTALIDNGVIGAGDAIAQARQDMTFVRDRWASGDHFLTHDERPVIFNFGPQHLMTAPEWQEVLGVFGSEVALLTEDRFVLGASSGAYPWPPMWASVSGVLSTNRLAQYLDEFYARGFGWPVLAGSAFPGFHDYYEQAGIGSSYGYLDARNGATFEETLDRALQADADLIQIVTWNDFGEGTVIEPTVENGYRYLEHVQRTVKGLRDLPFEAADLELPFRLYSLRREQGGDPAAMAQLDEAAARLVADDPDGARAILEGLSPTDVEPLPRQASLSVAPNPTDGTLTLHLESPVGGPVQVDAFDLLGRRVATRSFGPVRAGSEILHWSMGPVSSGVYVLRVTVDDRSETRMVVVR